MQRVLVSVATILLLATPVLAQQPDRSAPAKLSNPPSAQQKSGTAPGGTSAHGWAGSQVKKPEPSTPGPTAATESELATGVDLKGPPKRFEGSATPE